MMEAEQQGRPEQLEQEQPRDEQQEQPQQEQRGARRADTHLNGISFTSIFLLLQTYTQTLKGWGTICVVLIVMPPVLMVAIMCFPIAFIIGVCMSCAYLCYLFTKYFLAALIITFAKEWNKSNLKTTVLKMKESSLLRPVANGVLAMLSLGEKAWDRLAKVLPVLQYDVPIYLQEQFLRSVLYAVRLVVSIKDKVVGESLKGLEDFVNKLEMEVARVATIKRRLKAEAEAMRHAEGQGEARQERHPENQEEGNQGEGVNQGGGNQGENQRENQEGNERGNQGGNENAGHEHVGNPDQHQPEGGNPGENQEGGNQE